MVANRIMGKIFKSVTFIVMNTLLVVGMMAIMISFLKPEILDSAFIISLMYKFFIFFILAFLVAVLTKIDVGIWH
jgi:hypothetical protein